MTKGLSLEDFGKRLSILAKTFDDVQGARPSEGEEEEESYDDGHVEKLRSAFSALSRSHEFQPGWIVRWKENMKNKTLPKKNQPAIVIEVLEAPVFDDESPGSPYFREPLDLVLGVFSKDGVFLTFYYDSRRFEPYS